MSDGKAVGSKITNNIHKASTKGWLLSAGLMDYPIAVAVISRDGLLLDYNAPFEDWAPGAHPGEHMRFLSPKALYADMEIEIQKVCAGEVSGSEPLYVQHPKDLYLCKLHYQPYLLDNGNTACMISTIPSGDKNAVVPFTEYEDYELHKITFNTIDQGICIFDKNLRLVSWNQRYIDLIAPARELKYGDTLHDLCMDSALAGHMGPGDAKKLADAYCESMINRTMSPEEDAYPPNGKTVHIRRFYLDNGGIFGVFTDVTEQRKAEKLLTYQANYDSLTKTVNRKYILEYINGQISEDREQSAKFAVLFLDLDRFKQVNDSYGHHVGDQLLTAVVQRIQNMLNRDDDNHIARIGGDEFLLTIKSPRILNDLGKFANRVCEKLSRQYSIDNNSIYISVSIGISQYPADGRETDTLISKADSAMYKAKILGKNCFQFYNDQIGNEVKQRSLIANQLTEDLAEKRGFKLVYQPIFDCRSRAVCGAEALLRWNNELLGHVSPADFIPVAEESGAIIDLGAWVFEEVFKRIHSIRNLPEDFYISVNVSPLQILRNDFSSRLLQCCNDYRIKPANIMVEITESTIIDEISIVEDNLTALREAGFKVAIDDFGTGYSSLSYIVKHDFTHLKIDRMFIGSVPDNQNHTLMIKAIIELANALSLRVIAEGVETEQQLDTVADLGGHCIQGFLLGKPKPFEELQKLLN